MKKEGIHVTKEINTGGNNADKEQGSFVNQNYPVENEDTTNNIIGHGEILGVRE